MEIRPRLLRITTAPISLKLLLRGQFTYFQQRGFDVLTVSSHGREVKDIVDEGVPHQVVPMTRTITPVQDLICLWRLMNVMRKFKPDIVHTHTPKAGLLGMLAAWICHVPVRMHTVAGLPLMEAKGMKRTVLKITERITYGCATRVYPNSKGLLEFIGAELKVESGKWNAESLTLKVESNKFKVIGRGSSNGIDSTFFSRTPEREQAAREIRKQHQIPESAIVFCFVGRVVKDKGIVELITAFKMIGAIRPDAYLILVGPFEHELDPLPEEVVHFIQHDRRVIAAGYQQDVRPWMMASDVFVFPSYREGFPNVVMQAACLEVPCVVSEINGCNEIIQHDENGLIIPPKDADALCDAMKVMMMDVEKRKTFAARARIFVSENFDQQYVWGELLNEYQHSLKL